MRHKYRMPPQKRSVRSANRGPMPEGTTPLSLVHSPPSTVLVLEEIPADINLVRCCEPNQSPHVVAAAAVVGAGGSADLRPSAAASSPIAAQAACSPLTCFVTSAAPAGATISCLVIVCSQAQATCLRGAPRCRRVRKSDNIQTKSSRDGRFHIKRLFSGPRNSESHVPVRSPMSEGTCGLLGGHQRPPFGVSRVYVWCII